MTNKSLSFIKRYLPANWLQFWTNIATRLVNRKTVVVLILIDLLFGGWIIWFLYHYGVRMIDRTGTEPMTRICIVGARLLCGLWGLYVVCARRVGYAKLFYGLFFLISASSILPALPIIRMTCDCSSYQMCENLKAFEEPHMPIRNRYDAPEGVNSDQRRINYKVWPADPVFAQKIEVLSQPSLQVVNPLPPYRSPVTSSGQLAPSSLLDGELAVSTGTTSGGAEALKKAAEGEDEDTVSLVVGKAGHLARERAQKRHSHREDAHRHLAAADEMPKRLGLRHEDEGPAKGVFGKHLRFFTVSDDNIRWIGREAPFKYQYLGHGDLGRKNADGVRQQLESLRKNESIENLDPLIAKEFLYCMEDEFCGGIEAGIGKGYMSQPALCFSRRQLDLTPVLATSTAWNISEKRTAKEHELNSVDTAWHQHSVFFRKMPRAIQDAKLDTDERHLSLEQRAARQLGPSYKLAAGVDSGACRCSDHVDNCMVFKHEDGKNRFWCYVAESSKAKCQQEGISLYLDEAKKQTWTDEICEKATCKRCSGISMHPDDIVNVDWKLLTEDGGKTTDYGRYCNKWRKDDKFPWCFVGVDSTCLDRETHVSAPDFVGDVSFANTRAARASTKLLKQYSSSMPCDMQGQEESIMKALHSCKPRVKVAMLVCTFQLACGVLMWIVLFMFIGNRCADYFELNSEAFDVVSEEDSEDDFDARGTPKATVRASSFRMDDDEDADEDAENKEAMGIAAAYIPRG